MGKKIASASVKAAMQSKGTLSCATDFDCIKDQLPRAVKIAVKESPKERSEEKVCAIGLLKDDSGFHEKRVNAS